MRAVMFTMVAWGLGATAYAQSCPSGAHTGAIPANTAIEIVAINSEDAYYSTRGSVEGVRGNTTAALTNNGDCWYGGPVTGNNGTEYYFYKAAIRVAGGCPAGAMTGSNPAAGSRVRIAAISPDDAYYSSRSGIEGATGVSVGLHNNDGCWYGGEFTADNGTEYYFYKAAITAASGDSCPSGASRDSSIPSGTPVRITGLSSEDAYSSSGIRVVGLTGTSSGLNNNGDCWFGGGFVADDGSDYYFYKAAVEQMGRPARPVERPVSRPTAVPAVAAERCPAEAITSSILAGAMLRVEGISSQDPYARGTIVNVGDVVTTSGEFQRVDGCWYSGDGVLRSGVAVSFTRAAFGFATEKDMGQ